MHTHCLLIVRQKPYMPNENVHSEIQKEHVLKECGSYNPKISFEAD